MPRILLGVCGGIAAYKALEFTRLALKAGHSVRVVQTEAATRFVGPASFAGITGAPVLTTEWEPDPLRGVFPGDALPEHAPLSHLALVERADAYLVAPATAQTIAKLATGAADNLLTAAALACRRPLIVAPAMNNAMYEHPATQANLATLRTRGVTVLEPGTGALGSPGEFGIGRLPEPAELLAAVEAALQRGGELDGLNVLVTAAGRASRSTPCASSATVRRGAWGSRSRRRPSGAGPRSRSSPRTCRSRAPRRRIRRRADRRRARRSLRRALRRVRRAADGGRRRRLPPQDPHAGKLKKDQTGGELNLRLVRTADVLSSLSERRRAGQLLVGFAAEHGDGALDYGRDKLARKKLDAIVVNDIGGAGIGFESADNEVWIVTADDERHVPRASKARIAAAILDAVLSRRSSNDIKVRR